MRGSWRPNRTATYWPPLLWPQQCFFPVLLGCSTVGPVGPETLGAGFFLLHLISNWSDLQLTDFLSTPGLYNNLTPTLLPASVTILHSFNPSTVKVIISWYSSTGWTSYLHRCISYFDRGSEFNMQHKYLARWLLMSVEFNTRFENFVNVLKKTLMCFFLQPSLVKKWLLFGKERKKRTLKQYISIDQCYCLFNYKTHSGGQRRFNKMHLNFSWGW